MEALEQGYLRVGDYRDILRLGIIGIFGGWSLKSVSSRARIISILKSNILITMMEKKLSIASAYPSKFIEAPSREKESESARLLGDGGSYEYGAIIFFLPRTDRRVQIDEHRRDNLSIIRLYLQNSASDKSL